MSNYTKLLSTLALFILISCEFSNKTSEPKRLYGIPMDAFWVGSHDGGNWYSIKDIHPHKNMAYISIYNDQTGELDVAKKFMLICQIDNMEFIKDLKKEIVSFDGKHIHLKSGCYLQ